MHTGEPPAQAETFACTPQTRAWASLAALFQRHLPPWPLLSPNTQGSPIPYPCSSSPTLTPAQSYHLSRYQPLFSFPISASIQPQSYQIPTKALPSPFPSPASVLPTSAPRAGAACHFRGPPAGALAPRQCRAASTQLHRPPARCPAVDGRARETGMVTGQREIRCRRQPSPSCRHLPGQGVCTRAWHGVEGSSDAPRQEGLPQRHLCCVDSTVGWAHCPH